MASAHKAIGALGVPAGNLSQVYLGIDRRCFQHAVCRHSGNGRDVDTLIQRNGRTEGVPGCMETQAFVDAGFCSGRISERHLVMVSILFSP